MYRILIVEDDMGIAQAITKQLNMWDLDARCVEDFRNVLSAFSECNPHLILLDISLPFYNGYHWCSQIRQISQVPIIFISSAADNMNIVMAVNMGGDDFVAKPFDLNVLMAKVQAMLRRSYDFAGQTNLCEHRGVILNASDVTVVYEGMKVELTKNEFKILQVLMEQKGHVVSRDKLMIKLWESDSYVDDNTLTVNVARLRKKLEETGIVDFITTKKGIGYIIE